MPFSESTGSTRRGTDAGQACQQGDATVLAPRNGSPWGEMPNARSSTFDSRSPPRGHSIRTVGDTPPDVAQEGSRPGRFPPHAKCARRRLFAHVVPHASVPELVDDVARRSEGPLFSARRCREAFSARMSVASAFHLRNSVGTSSQRQCGAMKGIRSLTARRLRETLAKSLERCAVARRLHRASRPPCGGRNPTAPLPAEDRSRPGGRFARCRSPLTAAPSGWRRRAG
jgi:hypothetical protein